MSGPLKVWMGSKLANSTKLPMFMGRRGDVMDGGGEEAVSGHGATLSSENEKHCQSTFLKYRTQSILY